MRIQPVRFLFFIAILISLFAQTSRAQRESYLDSLSALLGKQVEIGERAGTLKLMAEEYLKGDPGKALEYCDKLLESSFEEDYLPGIIDGYSMKGNIYRTVYLYDTALMYTEMAIRLSDSAGDAGRSARVYSELGHTLFRAYGPLQGIDPYHKSYELYRRIGDSSGMTNALNGIGVMYRSMSSYDSAITYYHKLIGIAEKLAFEEVLGKAYLNLGIAYTDVFEYDLARTFLLKSIPINEKLNNESFMALAYLNIGNVVYDQGFLEEALGLYQQALDIYEEIDDGIGLGNVLINIGNIHEKWGKNDEAMKYYTRGKELHEKASYWNGFVTAYKNIGMLYERKGEYEKTLAIYDSCLLIADRTKNLLMKKDTYHNLYMTSVLMGNYRKALEYIELRDLMNDSIFNIEKTRVMAEYQMKYDRAQDQARILQLSNENLEKDLNLKKRTIQRNILLFSGIGIIAAVLFILFYLRQKSIRERLRAEQRIQKLEEEKKMLAAKALVEGQEDERKRIARDLHDGLGVLLSTVRMQFTSIRDKSPENQPLIDKAASLLEQATGDVRKISQNMMPGLLTRLGLFEAIEDLMEKVGETGGIEVVASIPEEAERMPENKEIMIYRIIQEMVNNTLKHSGATRIEFKMEPDARKLVVKYADNGKGFDVGKQLESKSIGLPSIQSRMNFLNGIMKLDSEPGKGTRYLLEIPLG